MLVFFLQSLAGVDPVKDLFWVSSLTSYFKVFKQNGCKKIKGVFVFVLVRIDPQDAFKLKKCKSEHFVSSLLPLNSK